jgi:hypothetical protein
VIVVHVGHVITAKSTHVASTKSTHMISAEATHVASAEAAHVAAAAAAAAGLCTRRNQAAGKQCTSQNHHCSSSHNILHLDGRTFRHRALSDVGAFQQSRRQRRDELEIEILFAVSTKFRFNQLMNP